MIIFRRFTLFIIVWGFVFHSSIRSFFEKTFREKDFDLVAPAKWNLYLNHYQNLQGTFRSIRLDRLANNKVVARGRSEYKHRKNGRFFLDAYGAEERCWVENERYAFHMKRPKENDSWIVTRLEVGEGSIKKYLAQEHGRFLCPFFVHFQWVPEWVKKPGFKTITVKKINQGKINFVKVQFEYSQDEWEKKNKRVHDEKGWFLLDLDQYWRVCEYEVDTIWPNGDKAKVHGKLECSLGEKGFPLLTRVLIREIAEPRLKIDHEIREEYYVEEREPLAKEFTLPAFDIPEPPSVPQQGSTWYLWAGFAAGVCIFAALYFRWRVKRLATNSSRT